MIVYRFSSVVIFIGALCSCASSLKIKSLSVLPDVPANKSRIVHIVDNSPGMWNVLPIYVGVDERPAVTLSTQNVSYLDLSPGRHLFSYEQAKTNGARDGLSLDFLPGETKYLYLQAQHMRSGFYMDNYKLLASDIDAMQAEALIQSTL